MSRVMCIGTDFRRLDCIVRTVYKEEFWGMGPACIWLELALGYILYGMEFMNNLASQTFLSAFVSADF